MTRRTLWALAILALAILIAGCAGSGTLNPGANPARLVLKLNAWTDSLQVNQAITTKLPPLDTFPGGFSRIEGPFWDYGVYRQDDDGGLTPLARLGGERIHLIETDALKRTTVFEVPPGPQRLRLLVEVYVMHVTYDAYNTSRRPVGVATYRENLTVDLPPGGEKVLERNFGTMR